MVNLGANAVKFTAKDKKVVLKCDMLGQDDESMLVRFVLEDEGIGIKESNRQCIFEAFNQGGRSTDAFYGGTGLGLAISQKLAHMMGSEIKLVRHLVSAVASGLICVCQGLFFAANVCN